MIKLPCGQCAGCRLERSRQWALRCVHESSLHSNSYFVTLTFNESHVPTDGCVRPRHLQLFMKRLRKWYDSHLKGASTQAAPAARECIRFYGVGEYGDSGARPHYHLCLFGLVLPDLKVFQRRPGYVTYTSATLERLWPFGFALVAELTFETAAYAARYVMKKMTGGLADRNYVVLDDETGALQELEPEFSVMSRGGRAVDPVTGKKRGGLGRGWFNQFGMEVYNDRQASCIVNGREVRPPVAYDRWLEVENPEAFARLKLQREVKMKEFRRSGELHPRRLSVQEEVLKARQKFYTKRSYESQ